MSCSNFIPFYFAKQNNHSRITFKNRIGQNFDRNNFSFVFIICLFVSTRVSIVQGFCGDSIKWSHNFNIEDVYGMWYGVGYAQHTPDMTNKPNEVGCVTLFITDATTESHDDWLDWSIIKKNYSDQQWRSDKNLPWSDTSMAGSWLNVRITRNAQKESLKRDKQNKYIEEGKSELNSERADRNRNRRIAGRYSYNKKTNIDMKQNKVNNIETSKENTMRFEKYQEDKRFTTALNSNNSDRTKRDIYNERRIRVIWDEDGQSLEQTYLYTPKEPGLWVADKRPLLEREMRARGIELWYPDDPPRHPQVIRILKVTPNSLTINHCSELGGGGIFSLILRRTPTKIKHWEWYNIKRQFFNFDLPNIHRYTTVCAGCVEQSSLVVLFISLLNVIRLYV